MRTPKPSTTHKPNDFCTIAQAEYIANLVVQRQEAIRRFQRPHRKLIRLAKRLAGRLRTALRLSNPS